MKQYTKTSRMKRIGKNTVCIFQIAQPFFRSRSKILHNLNILRLNHAAFNRYMCQFHNTNMMQLCIPDCHLEQLFRTFHRIINDNVMINFRLNKDLLIFFYRQQKNRINHRSHLLVRQQTLHILFQAFFPN